MYKRWRGTQTAPLTVGTDPVHGHVVESTSADGVGTLGTGGGEKLVSWGMGWRRSVQNVINKKKNLFDKKNPGVLDWLKAAVARKD